MKTAGIVCEYNPLHNGHVYQINKTRQAGATHIVCVMSGDFVQRGDCAVFSKFLRARAAIKCGADLVVELPAAWSCDSAPNFALGSVAILDSLGIDFLSFGTEFESKELLQNAAKASFDGRVGELLKKEAKNGASYPAALCKAVREFYGKETADVISRSNSTLAVEYIKALTKLESRADVFLCKRKGPEHDELEKSENLLSAGAIRALSDFSFAKEFIPKDAFALFENSILNCGGIHLLKQGERAVLSSLRELKKDDFELFVETESGLCRRIYSAVRSSSSLEELFEKAKTKSVTMAKIRRSVMRTFLRLPSQMSTTLPPYAKVLAANKKGFEVLSKSNGKIPVVTKHSEVLKLGGFASEVYDAQCRATDLYGLFSKKIEPCGLEQTTPIIIE